MQSPPPVMFPRGPILGSFPRPQNCPPTGARPVEDQLDNVDLTSVDLQTHVFRTATKEITKPHQIEQVG